PPPYVQQPVPNTVPTHHAPYPPYGQPGTWHPQPQFPPRPLPPKKNNVGKWIGTCVAVVAGLVWLGGCVSVLKDIGDSSDGSSSSSSSSSSNPSPLPDPKPATFKDINIPAGYYIRFADSPPKPLDDDSYDDWDLSYDSDGADTKSLNSSGNKMVLLNNAQKGSLKTCRNETRYADQVTLGQLSQGSQLCVHTLSGHIALVTFEGSAPATDPSDFVTVDMTVWRNAEEPTDDGY
ncbi:serine/threonine protein kinase, partial [Streptomyces sp. YC419]|nr:serine/threonine protein kinase [Streptomyces ureilyticus]